MKEFGRDTPRPEPLLSPDVWERLDSILLGIKPDRPVEPPNISKPELREVYAEFKDLRESLQPTFGDCGLNGLENSEAVLFDLGSVLKNERPMSGVIELGAKTFTDKVLQVPPPGPTITGKAAGYLCDWLTGDDLSTAPEVITSPAKLGDHVNTIGHLVTCDEFAAGNQCDKAINLIAELGVDGAKDLAQETKKALERATRELSAGGGDPRNPEVWFTFGAFDEENFPHLQNLRSCQLH